MVKNAMGSKLKILGLILFFGIPISGCAPKPNRVDYVFPNGFRGIFEFMGREPDGIAVLATNNVRTFLVPLNGRLKIKEKLPTHELHSPTARYASGIPIPIFQPSSQISKDAIALRSIGSIGQNEDWFVVGTYEDAAKAQEKLRGFKWPSK